MVTDGTYFDEGQAVVTVTPVNDDPMAGNDAASVDKGASVSGNVISGSSPGAEDTDVDIGDVVAVTGLAPSGGGNSAPGAAVEGAYGTLVLNADGSYSYSADSVILDHLASGTYIRRVYLYSIGRPRRNRHRLPCNRRERRDRRGDTRRR